MKKRYAIILFIVSITLICFWYFASDQDSQYVASDAVSKPKVRMMAYGSYKVKEFLEEAIKDFEEQDQPFYVSLEVVPSSFNQNYFNMTGFIPDYEQKLLLEFAAGDPPDLFFLPPSRGEIYRESGALVDISPYIGSDKPQYGLQVGQQLACIAQETDKVSESMTLLKFLYNYTFEYKDKFEATFIEESLRMPGDYENVLEAPLEDFMKMWNQLVLNKKLDKLIVFPRLFTENDMGWAHNFYQHESGPALWVSVMPSPDKKTIANASVGMNYRFEEDPEMVSLFKQCIINLIEVVEPEARIQGSSTILKGLGADENFSSLDFLNMIGSYKYNGIAYSTYGPDGFGGDSYGLLAKPDDTPSTIYNQRLYLLKPSE